MSESKYDALLKTAKVVADELDDSSGAQGVI